ncbi:MAG: adenosine deaminase [Bdellovibrionia bacterium]
MPQKLYVQEIRQLPKVDLHRHLDCSLRWSTVNEVAQNLGLKLPQLAPDRAKEFLITEKMDDLGSVLNKFLNTQKLLSSEDILERLAFEACEDAFNDGVYLLELRYAPTFIADGHPSLTFENIHQALLRGIQKAEKTFPMAVGLICIIQRIKPYSEAENVVDFAIENKESFIALDLADNEVGFEPQVFAPLFNKAKKSGLHITVHSGEAPHPDAGKWMLNSIETLGAERIGHGVQSIHHPEVLKILKEKNIHLEICPISNYLTQAFKTIADNPIHKLMSSGISVSINSDDPGVFATQLSDDYNALQSDLNFSVKEFTHCNQMAFEHSFIPQNKKSFLAPLYFPKGV